MCLCGRERKREKSAKLIIIFSFSTNYLSKSYYLCLKDRWENRQEEEREMTHSIECDKLKPKDEK